MPHLSHRRTNRRMGGNHMIILPISLTIAAGAALLNLWLALRVGRVRTKEKVFIGDGGNDLLTRRMRAHSNFVENRSEEHTSELQSLMRISYAVFCLKKKKN